MDDSKCDNKSTVGRGGLGQNIEIYRLKIKLLLSFSGGILHNSIHDKNKP